MSQAGRGKFYLILILTFLLSNGTGVRCHVAGWGNVPLDVPLVPSSQCNSDLKRALDRQSQGLGSRFQLDSSEICAGGEIGKDACTGDGGSPLVCQAQSGRWTVVGLVTWGIGCASHLPGVYVDLYQFRDWINSN